MRVCGKSDSNQIAISVDTADMVIPHRLWSERKIFADLSVGCRCGRDCGGGADFAEMNFREVELLECVAHAVKRGLA
jgi:hypothetical protein